MNGIGPRIPLTRDNTFGVYSLVSQYKEEIHQNLKNLLLTAPGERMMNPDFGVGMRHFLFEPRNHSITAMRQRIAGQVRKYMPFIRNLRTQFDTNSDQDFLANSNILSVTISYDVPSLNLTTSLVLQKEDVS